LERGVNHLTDRTDEEFRVLLGYDKSLGALQRSRRGPPTQIVPPRNLPTSIDWRTAGIISSVKDQGECGSCWTFGTTETIESYWALKTGQLQALSEQQILDCTPNIDDCGGTGGCGGGTAELAMGSVIQMSGIHSEWTYGYTSWSGKNFPECRFNETSGPTAFISGYVVLETNDYIPVLSALASIGPLIINVDASSWSAYESGVYDGCNQTNPDIDHVVQLVGYGTDPEYGDYWLVRNSWTPKWGEYGYIRLARSSNPPCGVDITPQDGIGCNGGPSKVPVCGTCGVLYDVSFPVI